MSKICNYCRFNKHHRKENVSKITVYEYFRHIMSLKQKDFTEKNLFLKNKC